MEQTIRYKGYDIEIVQDTDARSPDDWGNDECFLVYGHRDFTVEVKGFDPMEIFAWTLANKKRTLYQGYFIFPVYAYIHSGVALSLGRSRYPFNDRWDVSFKGFALVKRMKGTWTEEKAREQAVGLIETWNTCLSGDVYGYNIEDLDESCYGYYGNIEESGLIDDAKSHIDWHVREEAKKKAKKVKQWIQNKVPFEYR